MNEEEFIKEKDFLLCPFCGKKPNILKSGKYILFRCPNDCMDRCIRYSISSVDLNELKEIWKYAE